MVIDIHCHILPGVDDGAKDEAESLQLARQAAAEGIRTIIATPHHKNGSYENRKIEILERTASLNTLLRREKIDLVILPGQENRIYGELVQDYEQEEILPLNHGPYLFIEFPTDHVPRYSGQLLYEIQMKGLVPVIVHPERNQEILSRPDMLYQFVQQGALSQVTASSMTGLFGKAVQKFSWQLIDANLTHFVASDAHHVTRRPFHLSRAFEMIEMKYSLDVVHSFQDHAQLLAEGKMIYPAVPRQVRKKKLLGIF